MYDALLNPGDIVTVTREDRTTSNHLVKAPPHSRPGGIVISGAADPPFRYGETVTLRPTLRPRKTNEKNIKREVVVREATDADGEILTVLAPSQMESGHTCPYCWQPEVELESTEDPVDTDAVKCPDCGRDWLRGNWVKLAQRWQ